MLLFRVDAKAVAPNLKDSGLKPARFSWKRDEAPDDKSALATVDFINHSGHMGTLISTVNEVEFK